MIKEVGESKCKSRGGTSVRFAVTGGAATAEGRFASRRQGYASTSYTSLRPFQIWWFHAPMVRLRLTHRLLQIRRLCRPLICISTHPLFMRKRGNGFIRLHQPGKSADPEFHYCLIKRGKAWNHSILVQSKVTAKLPIPTSAEWFTPYMEREPSANLFPGLWILAVFWIGEQEPKAHVTSCIIIWMETLSLQLILGWLTLMNLQSLLDCQTLKRVHSCFLFHKHFMFLWVNNIIRCRGKYS